MGTGTIIWYVLLLVFSGLVFYVCVAALVGFAREKRKPGERPQISALPATAGGDIAEILRGEFRAIRMANEGTTSGRSDIALLSTIIQKIEGGEHVETGTVIYLLSRMQGTEEVIETIKGAGA